jgi:gluconolactonase
MSRFLNYVFTQLDLPESIQMTNGGTGPYEGKLLLVTSGRAYQPPSVALVDPAPPHRTEILLNNLLGRQFNSLNDVIVHRQSGNIFFTDPPYGYLNRFRPEPLLPSQVYRLDPRTGAVRVVVDGLSKPNGIAFNANGNVAYM